MKPTHIYEFSDGTTMTLGPDDDTSLLTHPLTVLDGDDENHIILSRLVRQEWPDDLSTDERETSLSSFLQAGGSAAAMTLEVRRREPDGSYRQYIVGRPTDRPADESTTSIQVGEHSYAVAPNECFTADQAGEIVIFYYRNDGVPEGSTLRELQR
ncbi:hypothetical protein [Gordonia sp. OPL2]|uniref:hypothetical protein n=1 Tax=Gordonia sp. OPL2 TaxID=2486274 RepID=UPI0016566971|nr:hypothetical protein [Gordonia sp. OPL2]RPA06114.1 hypothetical protein EEB19_09555 [Gordonia sp. OPL2]